MIDKYAKFLKIFIKKHHESLIPSFFVLATFLTIAATSQIVNTTQFQTSTRAFDGKCNVTVNKGCYEGGCRAWEACNPSNGMCEWQDNIINSKGLKKCESDSGVNKPGSGSQPTQAVNQPTSKPPQQAATPKPGQCDDSKWFCLGECAAQNVRNTFGGNSAQWRSEKAKNEGKPGACDTAGTNPTSGPSPTRTLVASPTPKANQPTTAATPKPGTCEAEWSCLGECANQTVRNAFGGNSAQWRSEKAKNEGKPGACDTVGINPTAVPTNVTSPTPKGASANGCLNYVSNTYNIPDGYCSESGDKMYICDGANWKIDTERCPAKASYCIGAGYIATTQYPCCAGLVKNNQNKCYIGSGPTATPTTKIWPTVTPTKAPTAIVATKTPTPTATIIFQRPTMVTSAPTATRTPTPTKVPSPSPTMTIRPSSTATPTKIPTATLTPTKTPSPTKTLTPTRIATNTPTVTPASNQDLSIDQVFTVVDATHNDLYFSFNGINLKKSQVISVSIESPEHKANNVSIQVFQNEGTRNYGGSVYSICSRFAFCGRQMVTVKIDNLNVVDESNEKNNEKTVQLIFGNNLSVTPTRAPQPTNTIVPTFTPTNTQIPTPNQNCTVQGFKIMNPPDGSIIQDLTPLISPNFKSFLTTYNCGGQRLTWLITFKKGQKDLIINSWKYDIPNEDNGNNRQLYVKNVNYDELLKPQPGDKITIISTITNSQSVLLASNTSTFCYKSCDGPTPTPRPPTSTPIPERTSVTSTTNTNSNSGTNLNILQRVIKLFSF